MDEIGKREVRLNARLAREGVAEAWWQSRRVLWLFRTAARGSWCALTGRHAWGEWRESLTLFVPPEQRRCRRCGGVDYRGAWPGVKVEMGSLARDGAYPRFKWRDD